MKMNTKYPVVGNILTLLGATFLGLLASEFILRSFAPIYPVGILKAYEYDQELGIRLRPGVHLFRTTDFQEEVRVNHIGTVNFKETFDDYKSLIFAVGDSYTQGTGLPSDMSYPAQLDLLINQNDKGFYAKEYGVVNLGLGAFGGEQELLALRRWSVLIGKPSIVLYLGCDNDYMDDILFKAGYRHEHIVTGSPLWGGAVGLMQWLTNDLQIGLRLKLFRARLASSTLKETAGSEAEVAGKSRPVSELERPVLEKLVGYSREYGALLIVSWSDKCDSYYWLKSWADSNGIAFADWVPKVEAVQSAIPALPKNNQHSGGHHRGWVNSAIAREYARQIRANAQ